MTRQLFNASDNKHVKRFMQEINEAENKNSSVFHFKNDINTSFLQPEEKRYIKYELGYEIYWDWHVRAYIVEL